MIIRGFRLMRICFAVEVVVASLENKMKLLDKS